MAPFIVIVGRPNVGKSSLYNRICRSRDALVDNQPGVTRDRLYSSITYEDVPIVLVDTGGFDDTNSDPLSGPMKDQIYAAIHEADVILFLVDGRQGLMPGDVQIGDILRKAEKRTFIAVNKIDGPEHDNLCMEFYTLGFEHVFPVSAAHGYGVSSLMESVLETFHATEDISLEGLGGDIIRIAILGRPNVGKSSLINKLLGSERMLVSDIPGTTRDAVDTKFSSHGRNYIIVDTAGIRKKSRIKERIEKFSVIKSIKSLERCHVAIVVIEANEGVLEQDARICSYAIDSSRALVLVINKFDLIKNNDYAKRILEDSISIQLRFIPWVPKIKVSSFNGSGISKILEKVNFVYDQSMSRINTGLLNRVMGQAVKSHPPHKHSGNIVKFLYATQTGISPPTFVLFFNKPEGIKPSYERYLINTLRDKLNFANAPIKLIFRERDSNTLSKRKEIKIENND